MIIKFKNILQLIGLLIAVVISGFSLLTTLNLLLDYCNSNILLKGSIIGKQYHSYLDHDVYTIRYEFEENHYVITNRGRITPTHSIGDSLYVYINKNAPSIAFIKGDNSIWRGIIISLIFTFVTFFLLFFFIKKIFFKKFTD